MTENTPPHLWHITETAALASIMRSGLLPQNGRRSKLLGENTPSVYLFGSRIDAENGAVSWLAEELDGEITLLRISTQNITVTPTFDEAPSWEWTTTQPIPPTSIQIIKTDL